MAQGLHEEFDSFCDAVKGTLRPIGCGVEILKTKQVFLRNVGKELIASYSFVTHPLDLRLKQASSGRGPACFPTVSHQRESIRVPLDKEEHGRPGLDPPGLHQCCAEYPLLQTT